MDRTTLVVADTLHVGTDEDPIASVYHTIAHPLQQVYVPPHVTCHACEHNLINIEHLTAGDVRFGSLFVWTHMGPPPRSMVWVTVVVEAAVVEGVVAVALAMAAAVAAESVDRVVVERVVGSLAPAVAREVGIGGSRRKQGSGYSGVSMSRGSLSGTSLDTLTRGANHPMPSSVLHESVSACRRMRPGWDRCPSFRRHPRSSGGSLDARSSPR